MKVRFLFTLAILSALVISSSAFSDDPVVKDTVISAGASPAPIIAYSRWTTMLVQKAEAAKRELDELKAKQSWMQLNEMERDKYYDFRERKILDDLNGEFVKFATKWINAPDSVDAYLLSPNKSMFGDVLEGYPILEKHPGIPPELLNSIKKLMLNPKSYSGRTACLFSPKLGLRFIKDNETMTVLVCFSCEDWDFASPNRNEYFESRFSPVANRLKAIANRLFPGKFDAETNGNRG